MREKKILMLLLCLTTFAFPSRPTAAQAEPNEPITRPIVAEDVSPLEPIAPVARDGHRGVGFLRRPPGAGPFPAVVMIHGGLVTRKTEMLKEYTLSVPLPSRFLAAGYVVAVISYRSRDDDPQSPISLADCLAAVEHLRTLPYLDPKSIAVYGCSGGGDLALEVAAATDVAASVPEEPASIMFTGVFNRQFPKQADRFTPRDAAPISEDPKRYYTAEYRKLTREKIGRIRCPILIVQGDRHSINRFNAEVLIPELRTAGKTLEVITYAGQSHCFCFNGRQASQAAAALKAFNDIHLYLQRHLNIKPKPIEAALVKRAPISEQSSE